jgi:outer membrane protein
LKRILPLLASALLLGSAGAALAEVKIGVVNTERIFRDSVPAMAAEKKLKKEFEKRDQDLQKLAKQLQTMQEALEKNSVTMSETERRNKDREFQESSREFQRKRREFNEDLNQRRNEELAQVLERANKVIKQIAEAEKFDIIFQEAVYASPRIDITEKVIKLLTDAPPAAAK